MQRDEDSPDFAEQTHVYNDIGEEMLVHAFEGKFCFENQCPFLIIALQINSDYDMFNQSIRDMLTVDANISFSLIICQLY